MMQPTYEVDVLVVGARVAGATLAALLGDAGHSVLLIDRAAFPSPTLSTHFFRGAQALTVFDRLGVLDDLLALGAPPLRRQYTYRGGAAEATVESPQDPGAVGYCLSVRREPLDALLARRAAASPRVTLRERARLVGLIWERGRVVGARLALPVPEGEVEVRARIVVGADGRRSTVARAVGAPVETSDPPARAMYYRYVRDLAGPTGDAPDGAEFSRLGDEVAYVFPSDGGTVCVALSLNLAAFAWARTAREGRVAALLARHRGLAGRVDAATPAGPLLGCGPEASYVRAPAGPGWALVGDAGLHQDPWSGRGIDMAAVHATFLAEALGLWLGGALPEEEALAAYHRRRDAHGLDTYRRTVTLARDLSPLSA